MVLEVLRKQSNFDTNTDLAFQFRLARDLGMTVAELRATMSNEEYLSWVKYYTWEQDMKNKQVALAEAEAKKKRTR